MLSRAILSYLGLSWAISGYLGLSQAISGYIGLSWALSGYLHKVFSIRGQVEAGEGKLLQFETFFYFFITDMSYRGACTPKNTADIFASSLFSMYFHILSKLCLKRNWNGEFFWQYLWKFVKPIIKMFQIKEWYKTFPSSCFSFYSG